MGLVYVRVAKLFLLRYAASAAPSWRQRRLSHAYGKTSEISLQTKGHANFSWARESLTTISGWSEAVLKYIEHDSAADGSDMVDIVGRVRL